MRAMRTAATGLDAQQRYIDIIANNLANVNTTGFKRSRADFVDLIYQQIREPGTSINGDTVTPTGIQVGHGVRLADTAMSLAVGNPINTQKSTDVAIMDTGVSRTFFSVTMPDGVTTGYTRDGSFQQNRDGELVTANGFKLNPPITGIPSTALQVFIGPDGRVSCTMPGQTAQQQIGQMQVATFVNPSGLKSIGGNVFVATDASGPATLGNPDTAGFAGLQQGFLEGSNVQAVEELVSLIVAQRTYEMNSKVITASDEILQTTANLRR
jgi:flagellar basal-body rod protein FlgG